MNKENRQYTDWQLLKYALLNAVLLLVIFFGSSELCTAGLGCGEATFLTMALMCVVLFIAPFLFLVRFGAHGAKNYFGVLGAFFGVFATILLFIFVLLTS